MIRRLLAWWRENNPWAVAARNERQLDQLQRYGLTDSDRALFVALCRRGRPTPAWLADRLIGAADAARAAGEERVR